MGDGERKPARLSDTGEIESIDLPGEPVSSDLGVVQSAASGRSRQEDETLYEESDSAVRGLPFTPEEREAVERAATLIPDSTQDSVDLGKGQQIGPYEVIEELARGGIGAVYRARDPELEREVALKVLLSGTHAGARELLRFRQEARASAKLRHPGIVAVHDVGQAGGLSYLVMDLIDGESLAKAIERSGPPPPTEAAEVVRSLAEALAYAHAQGVLHRDLKPANVLLSGPERTPMLTDFGLAKDLEVDEQLTRTGVIVGTPSYMPPEQARGLKDLDVRADVYALGATLYHVLTGRPPFRGQMFQLIHKVLHKDPVRPSKLNPKVHRDLETICLKCMEKEREARYPGAEEVAADLGRYLRHEPIEAVPPTPVERLQKWVRRHPGRAAASVVLAGVLAVAGVLGVRAQQAEAKLRAAQEEIAAAEAKARAEREAERARVETILARARSGELAAEPSGLTEAVLELVRLPAGADLLVGELEQVTRALERVPAKGAEPLGSQQRAVVGQGRLDAARIACEALGRLEEPPEIAAAALRRYLAVEADPLRAVPPAVALCQHGGEEAVAAVHRARRRFGRTSTFGAKVRDALVAANVDLALAAESPTARFLRGEARLAQADYDGAIEELTSVLQDWPDSSAALGNRSLARRAQGDYAGALADLDRAVELEPKDARHRTYRAEVHKYLNDVEAARADLDQAIALDEGFAGAWHSRGSLRLALGDLPGAFDDLTRALDLDPSMVIAWIDRAETRIRMKRFEAAAVDVQRALDLDPDVPQAWQARGRILEAAREFRAAEAAYRKALERAPSDPYIWERLGKLLFRMNDASGAIEAFSKALELNPGSSYAYLGRGLAKNRLGRSEAAVADFDRSLELKPGRFDALANRALAHQRLGNHAEALADCDAALEQRPHMPQLIVNRAINLEALGRPREAVAAYDLALSIHVDPSYYYNRALVKLEGLGDQAGALADLERFVEMVPTGQHSQIARQVIAKLKASQ